MKLPDVITKRDLWKYVNKKTRGVAHSTHVLAVISILFEEMYKDFDNLKTIKIKNFANIEMKKMEDRKYFNVIKQEVCQGIGKHMLRFRINKKLRDFTFANLDIKR